MSANLTSTDNKKIAYQICKYLKSLKDTRPLASRDELDAMINNISSVFEIDMSSVDDFKAYNYYQYTTPELFNAGNNICFA